jgi:N-acyl-phosphatidylethanolamine-hydrolysing phospholipase D
MLFAEKWMMPVSTALTALVLAMPLGACAGPQQKPGAPYHHTTDGYRNPPDSPKKNATLDRIPWLFKRLTSGFPDGEAPANHVVPQDEAKAAFEAMSGRDTVTWIGHMTALLRLDGKTVLTDPWFSERASPFSFMGPKRFVPPGITIADLPPIDVVVISHNHYDHLDINSISSLPNRESITAVVPLGLGHHFTERGYGRVIELDWHESAEAAGLTFTAMPVIHWSNRLFTGKDETLWAAFAIESPGGSRVYFGGDAEYGPVYAENGKRYDGFDIALLSIGAYLPRVVMNGSHCVPADCLKLGLDVGAHTLLAMHWGTILLGDDGVEEGVTEFLAAGRAAGLADERTWRMKIGETREIVRRPKAVAGTSADPTLASGPATP